MSITSEMNTYDEWNSQGYHIRRGEKATRINGKLVFTKSQVSKKLSHTVRTRTDTMVYGLDWDDMDDMGEGGPFY